MYCFSDVFGGIFCQILEDTVVLHIMNWLVEFPHIVGELRHDINCRYKDALHCNVFRIEEQMEPDVFILHYVILRVRKLDNSRVVSGAHQLKVEKPIVRWERGCIPYFVYCAIKRLLVYKTKFYACVLYGLNKKVISGYIFSRFNKSIHIL